MWPGSVVSLSGWHGGARSADSDSGSGGEDAIATSGQPRENSQTNEGRVSTWNDKIAGWFAAAQRCQRRWALVLLMQRGERRRSVRMGREMLGAICKESAKYLWADLPPKAT